MNLWLFFYDSRTSEATALHHHFQPNVVRSRFRASGAFGEHDLQPLQGTLINLEPTPNFFFSFSFEMAGKLWEKKQLVGFGIYRWLWLKAKKKNKKKGLKKCTGRIVARSKEKRTRWTFLCPLNVIICKENGRKFELQQAVFRINPIFSCALVESERCLKKGVIQPQATRCSLFISLL